MRKKSLIVLARGGRTRNNTLMPDNTRAATELTDENITTTIPSNDYVMLMRKRLHKSTRDPKKKLSSAPQRLYKLRLL